MTVPALPGDDPCDVRLQPLPDYEPDDDSVRWSSLRPATGPQLRLVPSPQDGDGPPVAPAALARVLRLVLEVLDGLRPVGQLRSLLPDAAFEALLTRLRTVRPGSRHVLRRLRTCYPTETAVEVSVSIEVRVPAGRERVVAAAARFERDGDRWLCAALRLL